MGAEPDSLPLQILFSLPLIPCACAASCTIAGMARPRGRPKGSKSKVQTSKTVAVVPAPQEERVVNGRLVKTKFTEETRAKILERIAAGCSVKDAGLLAGLGRDTLEYWLYQGKHEADKYPDFAQLVEDVELARAQRRADAVDRIVQAGQNSDKWQANAWYLERTDPENWGRKDKVEHVNDAPRQQINQVVLVDPDAREAAFDLLGRIAGNSRPDITVGPSSRGELEDGRDSGG